MYFCKKYIILLIVTFFSHCSAEHEPYWVVKGQVSQLSANNFGISGTTKPVGRFVIFNKKVRYKIDYLPPETITHALNNPTISFRFIYIIIIQGKADDWSTTIQILTNG